MTKAKVATKAEHPPTLAAVRRAVRALGGPERAKHSLRFFKTGTLAIVATHHKIARGEHASTLRIAEHLLADEHDLIHKAVGWMLREVGKRDPATLRRFLDRHAPAMPRTALRYAIERFDDTERKRCRAMR